MPTYEFKCLKCTKKNKEESRFEIKQTISQYNGEAVCPTCGEQSKNRIYSTFSVHWGIPREEKAAGATKQRVDNGKRMKAERDKRKKEAEPGSRDAISNEYFTGTEVERGVIPAPPKKDAGV